MSAARLRAELRRLEALYDAESATCDDDRLRRWAAYRDRPADFQAEILGRELYSRQVDVCNAVAQSPVTVIPAGRACGKSYLLAGLVAWFLYTREGSRVITTGPDFRQVVSVLWSELRRALYRATEELPFEFLTGNSFASPQRLVISGMDRWEALGFAARTAEGFSGQHAGEMLVIVDEATGVGEEIWSAIDGLAPTRLVVCGNPVRHDSRMRELHDLAGSGTSATTVTVPISSLESPHADLETSPVGLASKGFLRYLRELHGEQSPWWRSNILGLFPGQESVQFLPTSWLDRCTDPATLADPLWLDYAPGPVVMAIDIGGGVGADKSVIVVRNSKQLLEVFASDEHGVLDDARYRLEPEVVRLAQKWGIISEYITYDAAGIGRNFGSYLMNYGLPCAVAYFGAGKGGRYFVNRRSANAFAFKRRLDPNRDGYVPFYTGGIPVWPALRKELIALHDAPMEVVEGSVKQAIEEKATLQARLRHSPDLSDSFFQSWSLHRG